MNSIDKLVTTINRLNETACENRKIINKLIERVNKNTETEKKFNQEINELKEEVKTLKGRLRYRQPKPNDLQHPYKKA